MSYLIYLIWLNVYSIIPHWLPNEDSTYKATIAFSNVGLRKIYFPYIYISLLVVKAVSQKLKILGFLFSEISFGFCVLGNVMKLPLAKVSVFCFQVVSFPACTLRTKRFLLGSHGWDSQKPDLSCLQEFFLYITQLCLIQGKKHNSHMFLSSFLSICFPSSLLQT